MALGFSVSAVWIWQERPVIAMLLIPPIVGLFGIGIYSLVE
jgi:hypothetical protein